MFKVVDITDYVDMTKVSRIPIYGPLMHILPVEGQDDAIVESLVGVEHITVYKKEDVPERLHYQDNRRIMPIIIIPDEGWQLTTVSYICHRCRWAIQVIVKGE